VYKANVNEAIAIDTKQRHGRDEGGLSQKDAIISRITGLSADTDADDKTKLGAALSSFRAKSTNLRIALRAANIKSTFARLRAQAKVSPAEIRKLDFAKLAATNDETVKAVLATYEAREPVILAGQVGTIRAIDASKLAEQARLASLEAETRANMASARKTGVRMAGAAMDDSTSTVNPVATEMEAGVDDHDKNWDEIVRAIKSGDEMAAKKLYRAGCKTALGDVSVDESEMAELMGAFADIESEFSSVVRLAGAISGTKV
jgi:hypothetical protein